MEIKEERAKLNIIANQVLRLPIINGKILIHDKELKNLLKEWKKILE